MTKPIFCDELDAWFDTDALIEWLVLYFGICRHTYFRTWERRLLHACWEAHHGRKPTGQIIRERISRDARLFHREGYPPYYVRELAPMVMKWQQKSQRADGTVFPVTRIRLITIATPVRYR